MKDGLRAVAFSLRVFSVACLTCLAMTDAAYSVPLRAAAPPAPPFDYDAQALQGARYTGPANLGTMSVDVVLQMRNPAGLLGFARATANPRSPLFRHFLTPQRIGDIFGAPRSAQLAVQDYFAAAGLAVQSWPQREIVRVVGSQATMEHAFGIRFGIFAKGGRSFYAPTTAPQLQRSLPITAVSRLVAYHRLRRPLRVVSGPHQLVGGESNALLAGYSPQQIAAAFDFTGAYNVGFTGRNITIGIMGTGPISDADAKTFRLLYGIAGVPKVRLVNVTTVAPGFSTGLQPAPPITPPCTGTLPACNPEDGEAQLDTEWASSLAPDSNVLFYLAYNPNECRAPGPCNHNPPTPAMGIDLIDDELQQAIADNAADVISISAGEGELDAVGGQFQADGTGLGPTEFATLAAEGISVFAASGDTGAEGCQPDQVPAHADVLCAVYPASDPNVTAVGGTTTPIGADGRLTGPLTAWGLQTAVVGGSGATGGGLSQFFSRPGYQDAVTGIVGSHRGVPDVAANGDILSGVSVLLYADPQFSTNPGPLLFAVGGTSASAPQMAAMWALVLQACKETPHCGFGPAAHPYRLGNANPLLYTILTRPSLYGKSIYDIVYGDNASLNTIDPSVLDPGYTAAPGYDLTSGVGAPFARNLINVITGR
ncbi:MAG TPA: S53 family peptidase [Candidatus Eremiobacteraceae bacterium]|nr:S53 family peptidase [Candidatus Eremiobacteraceae bacterium]